jgi:hypothetical protein
MLPVSQALPPTLASSVAHLPRGAAAAIGFTILTSAHTQQAAAIELSDVAAGIGGIIINGIDPFDRSGVSVSGAGDVNGDGQADLIVAPPFAALGGNNIAGESYVIFSPLAPAASGTYQMATLAGDGHGGMVTPIADLGDGARARVDFSDEDTANGGGLDGASREVVTITRSGASISNLVNSADVLWEITSDRTGFDSAEVTLNYLDPEVAGLPTSEDGLEIFQAPSPSGPWTQLPTTPQPERNEVKAIINGFSFFALADHSNVAVVWEIYE